MPALKMTIDYILQVLVNQGVLAVEVLTEVRHMAEQQEKKLERSRSKGPRSREETLEPIDVVVSLKMPLPGGREGQVTDEEIIMKAVAQEVGLPYRKIDPLDLDFKTVTNTLPYSFAAKHLVVPVGLVDQTLEVAICDPFNQMILDDVRRVSEYEVTPVLATREDIRKLISEFYAFRGSIAGAENQLAAPSVDLGNLEQYVRLKTADEIRDTDQHVKNAVDYLFTYAIDQRASDIHVEPKRDECLIRMRIDGMLHDIHHLPKVLHPAVVSRLKSISRLNIAEKRRPQDGRIKIDLKGQSAEVRVSTIPVAFGEKVVLRILNPDVLFRDLADLFLNPSDLAKFNSFLSQPHGIILVTGPTGSGKSTTLYSSLKILATEDKNITTVEDPIEMVHEAFNQIAVQPQIGVAFGSILRNILRQDPDIIMIGEMRDFETAENAIQAALTGHLVLSTLHTNDAPSAITRLVDIGAERFLVASTLIGVMAQRLLRRICPNCIEDIVLSPEEIESLGLRVKKTGPLRLKRGLGCDACRQTGYSGRLAAVEVMPFSDHLRQLTMAGEESKVLKRVARTEGMSTLRENALRLMLKGLTTVEEVLRVTSEE
ncbi:MAG: GspE/PulE family protein [Pseudomonadota bacterium]